MYINPRYKISFYLIGVLGVIHTFRFSLQPASYFLVGSCTVDGSLAALGEGCAVRIRFPGKNVSVSHFASYRKK